DVPIATPTLELATPLVGDEARSALDRAIGDGAWVGVTLAETESGQGQLALSFDGDAGTTKVLWASCPEALLRLEGDAVVPALIDLLGKGRVVGADVKTLVHELSPLDSSEPELLPPSAVDPARIFDVGVAGYLLDSDDSSYEVLVLAERHLSETFPAPTDELPQAALDAVACRLLVAPLRDALQADESLELFERVEMPLLPVLAQMEREGLHVDPAVLARQSAELGEEISAMAARIHAEAGEEFNIDSPMQLSHVLFDVMGLPTYGLKKTQRGYYSTNAKVLEDLAARYDIVAEVLDYRERAKIRGTYLDALPALVRGDGRIHTTFNQTVAATGRLSSSDPNLQNIPTRSELGHRVRQAFTVPEGHVFLACDYSQIELRLLAHLSADEHLVAAFNEGADFHAATAARVFGVPVDQVTPELRSRAKAVNFGIVYGQQAYGLASSLKIGRNEAQAMIDRYFEAYPGVRAYLVGSVAFAREHGYVSTMYGRRRHIRDINSRNFQARSFGERTAMNHPMQGSAADIVKIAMVRVASRLREEGLRSRLVLQIHDELDFEVPVDEVEALSALVRETMEGVATLRVPLIADVSYGPTWAEAK
ncbi:MAG: DNA polymerase I, partial [Atopobiaceae bacterium]|nr:DNA polymerase I [Atopobiaceae bacterium]